MNFFYTQKISHFSQFLPKEVGSKPPEGYQFHLRGLKNRYLQVETLRSVIIFHWRDSEIFPGRLKVFTGGVQKSIPVNYNSTGGIQISFLGVHNSTGGIQISFLGS